MTNEVANQKKNLRGRTYPSMGIENAIEDVKILKTKLGDGPYSRLVAAQALGYKSISGSSAVRVAALVHYGLLERVGDTYRQSVLASRILLPESEEDKNRAIIEAVKTPKIFRQLLEEYRGKSLPTLLPNILFHNYKISEKATKSLAKDFIKSLEYSGLLNNGVIVEGNGEVSSREEQQSEDRVFNERSAKVTGKAQIIPSGTRFQFGQEIVMVLSEELSQGIILGKYTKISEAIKNLEKVVKELNENKKEDSTEMSDAGES